MNKEIRKKIKKQTEEVLKETERTIIALNKALSAQEVHKETAELILRGLDDKGK